MNALTRLELPGLPDFFQVYGIEECGSTNTYIKERADSLPEGFTLIADRQTAGRGRRGRSFFSPGSTGLYMSLLLRPDLSPGDAALITPAAAVAAARAVDRCFGVEAGIKWVNDLYLNGKKICGILAESAFTDARLLGYTVLGVGVNLAPPEGGFPEELTDIVGAIENTARPGDRERLASAFLREFLELYRALPETPFLSEYRKRNLIKDRDVTVITADGSYPAHALGVEDDFSLALRLPDGSRRTIAAGEVSVRGWT